MAAGDIIIFRQALLDMGNGVHNLSSNTIKAGFVTSATTPTATTADPRWGAGGTTNFATNEVATGATYSAGGPALASVTWTLASNVATFRAGILTIATDVTGFANARWVIVYNDTAAGKNAICAVDLGATVSIQATSYIMDWNGATNDLFTISTP